VIMKTFVSEKNIKWIETNQSISNEMSGLDIDSLEIDNSTKDVLKKIIKAITDLQNLHNND